MSEQHKRDTEAREKVDQLEREVGELKSHSDATIGRVESALTHLAAAARDLAEIRRIEDLARR